eukprot:5135211-Amphidinium_carterae.1
MSSENHSLRRRSGTYWAPHRQTMNTVFKCISDMSRAELPQHAWETQLSSAVHGRGCLTLHKRDPGLEGKA